MTHDEQTQMHIANCQICTLADAMKTCPICKFNIGLAFREQENQKPDGKSSHSGTETKAGNSSRKILVPEIQSQNR